MEVVSSSDEGAADATTTTTTFDRADYDDERHYQCSRDDDIGVDIDLRPPADDVDEGNSLDEESDDGGDDAGGAGLVGSTNNVARMNEEEESARRREREALTSTPIFRHLTRHFSFVEDEAVRALAASRRRLRIARGRNRRAEGTEAGVSGVDDDATTTTTAREDEGELLEMAMDWLSLHLEESDLRRGFRVRKTNIAGGRPLVTTNAPPPREGGSFPIRAVPHESISVLPKLTRAQYEREIAESTTTSRMRDLTTDSIRMGFHSREVERAFSNPRIEEVLRSSGPVEDDIDLSTNGAILRHLVACVDSKDDGVSHVSLDPGIDEEMREASIVERDQEKDALEAIYAEGFQLLGNAREGSKNLHFRIEVHPTTHLTHPACNEKCHLHVMTRRGYPLTSSPMLWFTNTTLPPTLLRRISINMKMKAKELMGQAAVFDLVDHLSESLAMWQKQFMDEEALAEKTTEDDEEGGIESDDDEIDYHAHFTAEERKKLSRRQRQKLHAAEKAHSRDSLLLEKQRLKEAKESERRERVRLENVSVSTRLAEKAVNKRQKEWVEEEAEKAARKAMNDAFLRGEGRDNARDAADVARKEMLRFHGEIVGEEIKKDKREEVVTLKRTNLHDSRTADGTTPQSNEMTEDTIASADDSALQPPRVNSEATPKTLLLVEKLRKMYDEKAKEKADVIHLTDAASNAATDVTETVSIQHVPTPVVAPSPGIQDVLKDVLTIQREQPWLISPEARVPAIDDNPSGVGSPKDEARKNETSKLLRVELERKYSQVEQSSRGNGRHRNNNPAGDSAKQFQLMLAQRSKLPAYKMRDRLLSTISQNQVTVVSGDTGCGKTTQVPQLVLDDLIMNNRGAEANIIVTQPRRISAIGVSERIAAER